jgi:DNA-binding Xre family transcriptional regulator
MHYTFDPFWDSLKKKGITKYQLIHKYKISNSTIDKLEHDKGIQLETICRICDLLELRIEDSVRVVDDSYVSMRKKIKENKED